MADQWYYQLFGQEFGPVDFEVVAQKFNGGELGIRDMVRRGRGGTWVRAGSVGSLTGTSAVAVETADVATDIDSFMLVDEKALPEPQLASDIDSFQIVDEAASKQPEVATSIDAFILVDDKSSKRSKPPSAQRQSAAQSPEVGQDLDAPIWFVETLGQVLGPLPMSELAAMVQRSELDPGDLIRHGTEGRWIAADQVDGLFADSPKASPSPANRGGAQAASSSSRATAGQSGAVSQPRTAPVQAPAPGVVDTNWFCYINDQEYGPMSMADLQNAAAQGQITPNVYVKYGDQGEWVLASQVPDLFATAAPVTAPPAVAAHTPNPASAVAAPLGIAEAERGELVQQLLTLLKQGLSNELMGGAQPAAPMAGVGWYCNISGSVIGPVSIESLVQMVLQKRLFPDDLIRMGAVGEWFAAKTVPDLFPSSSPQGKGKKAGMDSAESVMARIDRMYQEAQESQTKAATATAASPAASEPAKAPGPRANPAGDALRSMNANIARGTKTPAKSSSSGESLGEQFANLGIKLDAKTLGVVAAIGLVVAGYFVAPMVMGNIATKSALTKLVSLHARITEDEGMDPTAFAAKSKDLIKQIDEINKTMKGGATGTAKRDVAKMGQQLKSMVEAMGKPKTPDAAAGASDYDRAKKSYDDYFKAARKKMGLK